MGFTWPNDDGEGRGARDSYGDLGEGGKHNYRTKLRPGSRFMTRRAVTKFVYLVLFSAIGLYRWCVCVCVWWYCVDLVVFVVRVVYWFVCVYNWFDDGLNVEFSSRFKCGCYSWTRHMMIFRTDWIIGAMTYVWFQWIRKWDVIFIIWVIRKYIEWKFTIWLLKLLYNVTHLKTEKARVRIVWKTK